MKQTIFKASMFALSTCLFLSTSSAVAESELDQQLKGNLSLFAPLPKVAKNPKNAATKAKVALGEKLYHEKRLSLANDISCNSCHNLDTYGVDNEPTSPGHKGQRGGRNSPTVLNAALHLTQFWDGRAADVEEQAKGPILNPIEMAMPSAEEVVKRLEADSNYVTMFKAAFPKAKKSLSYNNLGKAIGAFERTLLTPAPFDAYLKGKTEAISEKAKKGLQTFISKGCASCHNGVAVGGNSYQKLGVVKPWPNQKDVGRSEVTKNEAEKMFFKVPSLRNITKTGPYFHDGSVKSLDQAIRMMGEYQLGMNLSDEEVASIKDFLKSLTGKVKS